MLNLSSWKDVLAFIPGFKPKPGMPGLCCISLDSTGIYSAYVTPDTAKKPQLQWYTYTPYPTPEDVAGALKILSRERGLSNVDCSWVLQKADYKLLTIETPPVKPEELAGAVRWQIKDLINIPLDHALIQIFPAPFALSFNKPNNLQVAVTDVRRLQPRVDIIQECGLNLSVIDITELALRNINALFADEKDGLALVWLERARSKLLITREQALYVTRDLDLALNEIFAVKEGPLPLEAQRQLETLAIEIHRSLDYYRSQLKQTMPARVLVCQLPMPALDFLNTMLAPQKLELLNLSSIFNAQTSASALLSGCLDVIGGALRKDSGHDTTS